MEGSCPFDFPAEATPKVATDIKEEATVEIEACSSTEMFHWLYRGLRSTQGDGRLMVEAISEGRPGRAKWGGRRLQRPPASPTVGKASCRWLGKRLGGTGFVESKSSSLEQDSASTSASGG
ncbi:unnamed protein product [Dovyalis caffra]|uniref:Uncharacterized protein n=1 Tax=Dovyalis caffra TaxID=77055 RepID=A0AAV1R813_9ROSI|nr:unnamed protein product [Dovyalis caffra]